MFELAGCSVVDTSQLGDDFPDMIVARRKRTVVVEVKSGNGKPTDGQIEFSMAWRGLHAFVWTEDDALDVIKRLL